MSKKEKLKKCCEYKEILAKTISVPKSILTVLRIYPTEDGKYKMLNLYFIATNVVFCFFISGYSAISGWPDLPRVAYNLNPFCAALGILVRIIVFIKHRDTIYKLIHQVQKEFWEENEDASKTEISIIYDYAKRSWKYNIFFTAVVFLAGTMNINRAFVFMYLIPEGDHWKEPGRILPYKIWIPLNFDTYSDPYYQLFFFIQVFGIVFSISVIIAIDCLFMLLITNTCGQYYIVQERILNFDDFKKYETKAKTPEDFLKECIAKHQKLNKFSDEIEKVFSYVVLTQFLMLVVYNCTCGFLLIACPSNYYTIFENISYIMAGTTSLYFYCYMGEQLTESSSGIAASAYGCNWLNAPNSTKRILLFVIQRSQKPIYITAGKFIPVTLSSFEVVMHNAMSYLTVLKTVYEGD